MNGVKSWTVTLVFYFLILAVLIANLDGSSSLYGILPKRGPASPRQPLAHLQHLGVTGGKLLDFFQEHLLELPEHIESSSPRISLYYDAFKNYLYGPGDNARPVNCHPDRSIVAKLTRDVQPIPVHSHNDYWRDLPLFEGIAYGAVSTEADVWLVHSPSLADGVTSEDVILAVGHNEVFLDPVHRTLDQLYTVPLKTMLDQVNCREGHRGGLFYDSPENTLFFYIDFKSEDNVLTYKLLMDNYMKPLADAGYLTYYDLHNNELVWNQVTVVLTGDFPKDLNIVDNGNADRGYYNTGKRHVFQEADILDPTALDTNASVVSTASYSRLLEKCGSSDKEVLSQGQLSSATVKCIRSYIEKSHDAGLKTRIWGAPNWPKNLAVNVWTQQVKELEVDILNVDDLKVASNTF
ncbi:probable Altered inheritance of mitochondria protein 6 [Zygosaccharomyces bailii ISA1307]|nr:probable Altered inheritance of mitochondria protein 6 [Zygosaccharomyces bailii ISA1307]